LFGNEYIYNEAYYVVNSIPIFLNAEFVCSVDKYQPPKWRGNGFWTGRRQSQKTKNISFIFPKIAKHLHQAKMFNKSIVFVHSLVTESNRGSGGWSPQWLRFGGFTSKIIQF